MFTVKAPLKWATWEYQTIVLVYGHLTLEKTLMNQALVTKYP
jgi:hypothetical protein